jgi:hypothetical protein
MKAIETKFYLDTKEAIAQSLKEIAAKQEAAKKKQVH